MAATPATELATQATLATPAPATPQALTPRTFADLYALYLATPPWNPPEEGTAGTAGNGTAAGAQEAGLGGTAPTEQEANDFPYKRITAALKVDVLGRTESGAVVAYSEPLHRTVTIENIARVKFPDLLGYFGHPVFGCVVEHVESDKTNEELEQVGRYSLSAVRNALAYLSSHRMVTDETSLGLGIWPCRETAGCKGDDDQGEISAIMCVNSSEACNYNGHLEKITHPRHRESLLSFDTSARAWYEFETLRADIERAETDPAFRSKTIDDLTDLFRKWRWRSIHDPIAVAGLVLATWVQSVWEWRPRIDILGASNTGKSMLCAALSGIFHGLSILTSDTTAAGLAQKISNKMMAVIVDEVDAKNKAKMARQREILEMLRSASRGTVRIRGSGNQKPVEFVLRHLVWVAGITVNYDDQADRNRAISLNLLPPLPELAGKLVLPPPAELRDLGRRTLAIALWAVREARRLAVELKDTKIAGADPRIVESYAVPAGMVATVLGLTRAETIEFLAGILMDAKNDIPVEPDESNLVSEILAAKLVLQGSICLTVGQAIQLVASMESNWEQWKIVLAGVGIRLDLKNIVMNYGSAKKLLRGTRWEGQPIEQTLRRIQGAEASQQSIGGVKGRGVRFPIDSFMEAYIGAKWNEVPSEAADESLK